jgi:hypothetical protein
MRNKESDAFGFDSLDNSHNRWNYDVYHTLSMNSVQNNLCQQLEIN